MRKCIDCGLLSVRNSNTRQLVEVDGELRASGNIPGELASKVSHASIYEGAPICFSRAFELKTEYSKGSDGQPPNRRFLVVITRERDCPKFIAYEPGNSPKEHCEMQRELELRKWQDEREQVALNEARRRDADQKRHNWLSLAVAVAGGVFVPWLLNKNDGPPVFGPGSVIVQATTPEPASPAPSPTPTVP